MAQGDFKPHDLTLLKHEEMERVLIKQGYTQDKAHILASKKYNYEKEQEAYYDLLEERQNRK